MRGTSFGKYLGLLPCLALLAGCAIAPSAPQAAAPTAVPAAAATAPASGPVELTFWSSTGPTLMNYEKELVSDFTAKNPNITVNEDYVSYTDLPQKLSVALGTGTGPDVFQNSTGWLKPFMDKKQLAPISPQGLGYASLDAMKDAYLSGTLDPYIQDGKLYAVPYAVQSFSLYINTQQFREAGLDPDKDYPKTWDETLAIAKKLTKTDGGKITRQGFHFILINPTWVQFNFEPLVHQFGGDIVGPDGRCVMDGPAGVKALDLMASFVRGKVMDPSVTVATAAVAPGDFIQGVASMTVAHPATTDFIRQGNPAMWESKGFKVVPLPQVDASKPATMLNVNLFTINAATASSPAKLAAAHDFIRHLLAQPAQWLPRASSISPVKAARNAPEFKVDPFMDTYLSDVERGVIQTQSAYANELTSAMQRAEEAVLLSGADPQQALTHACQDVNRAIG